MRTAIDVRDDRHQQVLLELAALAKWDTEATIRQILRLEAETLRVERVNYWCFESDPPAIRCEEGYELSTDSYSRDVILLGALYPRYFRALAEEQFIAAEDAQRDPRTVELTEYYLAPLGIGAMLDIPVWVGGQLCGVLCHEHSGAPRAWTRAEREFAVSMGQLVATTLEVRERRRAQEALHRTEQERLALVTREELAREQVRARDEFFAIVAHELNTPLASLQLGVEALRTGGLSPERSERILARFDRQVGRLTRLVADLLDVSRIQAGGLIPAPELFDLRELAAEVADRISEELAAAGCPLVLHLDAPVVGRWDRSHLDQVITNLLANAAKFGRGAPIELTVAVRDARARLVVRDQGIGIPADKLAKIFDRYERGVSSRSYGGLGMGLFIVRAIVEAHGGTVRAESAPEQGTAVTVELPLEHLAPSDPPSERALDPGSA